VRVLLDENLPYDLIDALTGHSVSTVHGLGWAGAKNRVLLKRASGAIDVFVTMDTNLEHQQNVSALPFGIVVVGAPSNRIQDLAPLIPDMLAALGRVRPGTVEHVGRVTKRPDHLKRT
jgi:predicted nuclease of predicted toxin-antitoxin system